MKSLSTLPSALPRQVTLAALLLVVGLAMATCSSRRTQIMVVVDVIELFGSWCDRLSDGGSHTPTAIYECATVW